MFRRGDGDANQAGGEARQGERDAELAQRAARRIDEYLRTYPGAGPVTISGELAGDDALVVPRRGRSPGSVIRPVRAAGAAAVSGEHSRTRSSVVAERLGKLRGKPSASVRAQPVLPEIVDEPTICYKLG